MTDAALSAHVSTMQALAAAEVRARTAGLEQTANEIAELATRVEMAKFNEDTPLDAVDAALVVAVTSKPG